MAEANRGWRYTCRYEIQIQDDEEFRVVRRLIGANGCNMKRIIEMCSKGENFGFQSPWQ